MKKPFDIGDKVKVYATLNGVCVETPGEIVGVRLTDQMLRVNLRGRKGEIIAHPKQCRRLVTKPKRRMWVNLWSDSSGSAFKSKQEAHQSASDFAEEDGYSAVAVEFVEVRKK